MADLDELVAPKMVRDGVKVLDPEKNEIVDVSSDQRLCLSLLTQKLFEESLEFKESLDLDKLRGDPMELVDILTVCMALADAIGYSREDIEKLYQEKLAKKGGFDGRRVLRARAQKQ